MPATPAASALACAALALTCALTSTLAAADATPGSTRVARWLDDKQAAFVLMFDDSCATHVTNVVPELVKRKMIGTFYVVPGGGVWKSRQQDWEQKILPTGMEYGNHTYTHSGFDDLAGAEQEFAKCNEVIHQLTPDQPWPRIVSFAQPGGVKKERWQLTKEQFTKLLADNHLANRPDFGGRGAMVGGVKTAEEFVGLADKALKSGGMEAVIFHGVGGDWLTTPLPMFTAFLDLLEQRRDKLWITGHARATVYQVERDAASVKPGAHDDKHLSLTLSCTADPVFYALPLTLVTQVPAGWKSCTVTQGKTTVTVAAVEGSLRYDAVPGEIEIRPAR